MKRLSTIILALTTSLSFANGPSERKSIHELVAKSIEESKERTDDGQLDEFSRKYEDLHVSLRDLKKNVIDGTTIPFYFTYA